MRILLLLFFLGGPWPADADPRQAAVDAMLASASPPWLVLVAHDGALLIDRSRGIEGAVALGRVSALLPVLAADAAIADGLMRAQDPVERHVGPPFQLSAHAFETLRIGHLMTHSAGLAPPGPALLQPANMLDRARAARHVARLRAPGRAPYFDAMAIGLLALALADNAGERYLDVQARLLELPGVRVAHAPPAPFLVPALGLAAPPETLRALLLGLTGTLLPAEGRTAIAEAAPGWSRGFASRRLAGRAVLELTDAGQQLGLWVLPQTNTAILIKAPTRLRAALSAALTALSAPATPADPPAAQTRAADLYVPVDLATPSLRYAMQVRPASARRIAAEPDGVRLGQTLLPRRADGSVAMPSGGRIVFGEGRASAYVQLGERLYVSVGLLGLPALVTKPVLPALILVASGLVYAWRPAGPVWRSLARFCGLGLALYAFGVAAELRFWSSVWLEQGRGWLVVGWRLAFTLGLVLLAGVPILAVRLARFGPWPSGPLYPLAALHLTALTAGALYLVLMAFVWGFAGEIWP